MTNLMLAQSSTICETQQLSKTACKRRRAAHDALRTRFQEVLKKRRQRQTCTAAPPTHKAADLAEVLEWVDSLAGEDISL